MAAIAIAIGSLTTIGFIGGVAALVVEGMLAPTTPPTTRTTPHVFLPPVPTLAPSPAPTPRPTPAREVASKDTTTSEFKAGAVTVVDIGADVASLESELRAQRAKAQRAGEKLLIEATTSGCRPCLGVAASLVDPKMQKALAGVRLVRVDITEFNEELTSLGYPHQVFPFFFLVGTDAAPVDGINGGEWDDDTADNIAPVIGAFVRGKLMKRREPWAGQKRGAPTPRGGTEL